MDHQDNTTNLRKNKHLNLLERHLIQIRLKDGFSTYKIAKELGRSISTISNEIKRGTFTQIKANKTVEIYEAEASHDKYLKNRKNSCCKYKLLKCKPFFDHAVRKMKENKWSPDAIVGDAKLNSLFDPSNIVCAKTIYNYIDLGLLDIKNIDLPMKLKRSNKSIRIKNNKKKLGTSIEERPLEIQTREEFGHWEIDTVIGEKTNSDNVLLTLVERKTRYTIALKISSKTSDSVTKAIEKIKQEYKENFSKVFKTITSDNGSEFSKLALIEDSTDSKIYFTHPYSSYERGTNERHNGLIRRFIPKGKRISDFSEETISEVEEWMNTLPRRILGFKSPEDLLEEQLDKIYAA